MRDDCFVKAYIIIPGTEMGTVKCALDNHIFIYFLYAELCCKQLIYSNNYTEAQCHQRMWEVCSQVMPVTATRKTRCPLLQLEAGLQN